MCELSINNFVENELWMTQGGITELIHIGLSGFYQSLPALIDAVAVYLAPWGCLGYSIDQAALNEICSLYFDKPTSLRTDQNYLGKLLGMTPGTTYSTDTLGYIQGTAQCFMLQCKMINIFMDQAQNMTFSNKSDRFNQICVVYN